MCPLNLTYLAQFEGFLKNLITYGRYRELFGKFFTFETHPKYLFSLFFEKSILLFFITLHPIVINLNFMIGT